jgi:hypothetical protein
MKKLPVLRVFTIVFTLFCACRTTAFSQAGAPAWVTSNNTAFPTASWISVVEEGSSQTQSREKALSALAQFFKVDVRAVTTASREMSRTVSESGNKRFASIAQSEGISQNSRTETDVQGLIGVQTDFWTAADGKVWANARMNKSECSARYASLIKENTTVINSLISDAGKSPKTFRAAELLNSAWRLAVITDNYAGILSVLDTGTTGQKLSYGSAAQVKKKAEDAAHGIVISIVVKGDTDGRINRAFASFLKARGFGSNLMLDGGYLLFCDFNIDDVETTGATKAARYTISMTLTDWNGNEVFAYSGNGRQNNANQSEARQRALRAAEDSITKSGFGAKFDEYLFSQY